MMNNCFVVENTHVSYGEDEIIKGIDLSIREGEFCAILGGNGSGKTTFLHALCGFAEVMSGKVFAGDTDITNMREDRRSRFISFIPQTLSRQDGRSVLESVLLGYYPYLGMFEKPSARQRETAEDMLKKVGLEGKGSRDFGTLSQGEKQLCIIARCLVQQAGVMLLDEPDSALDFANRSRVLGKIRDIIHNEKKIGLISVHDPNYALEFCDRCILLKDGTIADSFDTGTVTKEELEEKLQKLYGKLEVFEEKGHFFVRKSMEND